MDAVDQDLKVDCLRKLAVYPIEIGRNIPGGVFGHGPLIAVRGVGIVADEVIGAVPLPIRYPFKTVVPVPPLGTPKVPVNTKVPDPVIGPPVNDIPVVPPEASTLTTVPAPVKLQVVS